MITRPVLTPGPRHPITVSASPGRVRVSFEGRVIAETDRALVLAEASYPPVAYVPLDDVDQTVLVESDSHTYCPYKGEASYYSLQGADGVVADAVWTYPTPYDAVAQIAGHVAFYPEHVTID